jgi:hypothetical protein
VLAAGGGSGIAELYDPATGTFSATQPLNSAADVDAAVLLDDGRVLLVRGGTDPSELFDPGTPRTATGSPTPGASEGPSGPTPPDACSLITSSELTAIRGVAAGPGDPSAGSPSAPDCVWPRAGGTGDPLLEISISLDDPRIWAAIARSPDLRPVTVTDHNALEGGDGLWVEASPYIVRIAGVNPVAGGAATAAPEQQLAILERILARLR